MEVKRVTTETIHYVTLKKDKSLPNNEVQILEYRRYSKNNWEYEFWDQTYTVESPKKIRELEALIT